MSTFREHKTIADRAASDRSRHRQKIEKAIKESIRDVVAEESIIGQSGKKKIRIPVKGIKEHRFVYGQNEKNKHVKTEFIFNKRGYAWVFPKKNGANIGLGIQKKYSKGNFCQI